MVAERRVRFHSAADREVDAAADNYDLMRSGLGDEFLRDLEHAINHIAAGPYRLHQIDSRHRRMVLRRFPFNIFFRFDDAQIFVVAVAHQKRRPGYWIKR